MAAILAVLLLVGVELAVRSRDAREMIPYVPNRMQQYEAVRDVSAVYGPASVGFLGSSRVLMGIDAPTVKAVLDTELARSASVANYACDWSMVEDVDAVVRHLLRVGKPELLVYGVTPRAVTGGSLEWHRAAHLSTPADWMAEVRRSGVELFDELPSVARAFLGRWWQTLRYRRRFTLWVEQDVLHTRPHTSNPAFGERAWTQVEHPGRTVTDDENFAQLIRVYVRRVKRFGVGEERLERLASILERCRAADVPLCVVELPLAPILMERYPRAVLAEFRARVSELAERHGARFVPLEELGVSLELEDFRDHGHLNLRGSRIFSEAVARRVVLPVLRSE